MKKIGIDARLANETGVGTYIRNLIANLPKDKEIEYVIYDYKKSPYRWHSIDEQTKFLRQLNADKLDLMHFTYFSYPYFYNKPFIITIHDLTPYYFKTGKASTKNVLTYNIKHYFYKKLLENAVLQSKTIITPTRTVKNQILETFHTDSEKIITTYEGINNELVEATESVGLNSKFGNNYFLYVGNFYPHKNVEILINVFKNIPEQKLVLVGKKDYFFNRINELIIKNNLQNQIQYFENATPGDLKYFYKNAKALIFPSKSEGFGLPIIEAAYFKCPIICSDISVFRELIPSSKYFFQSSSEEALIRIIKSNKEYDKTDINFLNFSFSKMGKETYAIYKKFI